MAGDGADVAIVLGELRDLEPVFHRSAPGSGRATFEAMTARDFWEVGASGRRYDRATVLEELERRYADPGYDPMDGLDVSEFAVRRAGGDAWLVTYRLRQGERMTRRLTVWRREAGRWVAVYHQGTIEG
jgi:hypothetical protein